MLNIADVHGAPLTMERMKNAGLTPRQIKYISLRYGLKGNPITLTDVGRRDGVSRQYVQQVIDKGMELLRAGK